MVENIIALHSFKTVFYKEKKGTRRPYRALSFRWCAPSHHVAPSHHAAPEEGQTLPRDVVVFQEGEAESLKRPNIWDPNLDAPSYIEEVMLHPEEMEKLVTHDEGHLIREAIRRFGQALATTCLATTKIKERAVAKNLRAMMRIK